MKFISHREIEVGDVIVWAFDPAVSARGTVIYYEVEKVERDDSLSTTIVHGKSFGAGGERWKNTDRKWDLVPYDRDILLISSKKE